MFLHDLKVILYVAKVDNVDSSSSLGAIIQSTRKLLFTMVYYIQKCLNAFNFLHLQIIDLIS